MNEFIENKIKLFQWLVDFFVQQLTVCKQTVENIAEIVDEIHRGIH